MSLGQQILLDNEQEIADKPHAFYYIASYQAFLLVIERG